MESVGYVLMYFLRGSLPWQSIQVKYKEERLLGEIGRNISSLYHLDTKEGVNNYEYYISKAAIEEMTRTKKGLRIEKDGTIYSEHRNNLYRWE